MTAFGYPPGPQGKPAGNTPRILYFSVFAPEEPAQPLDNSFNRLPPSSLAPGNGYRVDAYFARQPFVTQASSRNNSPMLLALSSVFCVTARVTRAMRSMSCLECGRLAAQYRQVISGRRLTIDYLRVQESTPTTAPVMQVARVPAMMDFIPSSTISARRSGTMVPRPPIIIPRLPKLANPHSA